VSVPSRSDSGAIFRPPTQADIELAGLRAELTRLLRVLSMRERALDELRHHLLAFEGRYIRQVGKLYKQLDEWENKTASLHKGGEDVADLEDAPVETSPATDAKPLPRPAALPAASLRALFRELALRIHPDHALDPADELRRTRLMAQANDAFRRKDARLLRRMLRGFDGLADAFPAALEEEIREAREAVEQAARDVAAVESDFVALDASPLAELERSALAAAREGRDLLAEMAARVKGRIGMAMRQYDLDLSRIRRPALGLTVETLLTAEQSPQRRPPRK
jgi:hypothetical protein